MGLFRRNDRAQINKPDTVNDTASKQVVESNNYALWQLINRIRDVSQAREYKYAEYDLMSVEVIISAALDMYADDATQRDENSNRIFGIESNDEGLKKDLYAFLNKMHIEDRAWDTAYNLAKYGNKYWKLYLTADGKDIDHLEEIDDPGCVLDLYYQGKPVYYAENNDDRTLYKNSSEFDLYDHDSFIHLYVRSGNESDVIELTDNTHFDKDGDPLILKYKIVEGESLIEGVRVIYRILRTLEDSLLAARLAKADYIRIFNIEVGESSNTDTRLIVNKVKKLFDSTVSMNIRDGSYSAVKQPRAWADPIFNSVTNGKGSIDVNTIGGDFEVKSIVDIDYFNNKLFAGLRIPKPLLGFEESINGGLNNASTMVQLDIRYGKFIKKLIDASVRGIEDLCNIWLKIRGRSQQIGKFRIVYNSPSSTEELAKLQELQSRVNIVSDLVDTIVNNTGDGVNKAKMLIELLEKFVPYQDFIDKIKPLIKDAIDDSDQDIQLNKLLKERQIADLKNPNIPTPPIKDDEDVPGDEDNRKEIDLDYNQSPEKSGADAIKNAISVI